MLTLDHEVWYDSVEYAPCVPIAFLRGVGEEEEEQEEEEEEEGSQTERGRRLNKDGSKEGGRES